MNPAEFGGSPKEQAKMLFNVDLDDDRAVLTRLRELQTKTVEVSTLSNLWSAHQEEKGHSKKGDHNEQPPMASAA